LAPHKQSSEQRESASAELPESWSPEQRSRRTRNFDLPCVLICKSCSSIVGWQPHKCSGRYSCIMPRKAAPQSDKISSISLLGKQRSAYKQLFVCSPYHSQDKQTMEAKVNRVTELETHPPHCLTFIYIYFFRHSFIRKRTRHITALQAKRASEMRV